MIQKTKEIVEQQKKTNKQNTKTKENTRKNNENQWAKTMISKEQHMKFMENQRKSMNTSRKNQWEPQKPMKNQRRNNEKQWKTKDNFASILSYFLAGTFGPCFFEVSIFNGERNKRQFWRKNKQS